MKVHFSKVKKPDKKQILENVVIVKILYYCPPLILLY